MEFIKSNFFNTTTQAVVGSNTVTVSNLLDRRKTFQYFTDTFNDDTTIASITINFDQTETVSRIGLIGMNWKDFTAFYNGVTANTFSLSTTAATITSDFSLNSASSMFLIATPVACTSVTFDVLSTQVANSEKALSHLYISAQELEFERLPSSKNYKPKIIPKDVIHRMANGGIKRLYIDEKYSVSVKYKHITEQFRNDLKTVYDKNTTLGYVPFGTSTAWDEIMFEAIWTGPFDFFEFSDDAAQAGFSGSIKLEESS